MIDAHVHLENGPLSKEYVFEFIDTALEKGIDHLQILDHTHRFYEFREMYADICQADPRQKAWFEKKQKNSIQDFIKLKEEVEQEALPLKVSWGLEVCYEKEREPFLRSILPSLPLDFFVGSVHSIDHYLYDISAFSEELVWEKMDTSTIYKKYYQELEQCIASDLFDQIGHPDVIKLYQLDPGYDLHPTYEKLAQLAHEHHVCMEDNTGAYYRYNHPEIGLCPDFRKILKHHQVPIVWASDAHYPEHVAMAYDELKGAQFL